jgi:hypothetical protein
VPRGRLLSAVLLTVIVAAGFSSLRAQTLPLPDQWRFRTGDDSLYARPGYDDAGWAEINVPAPWEREGFEGYDGIAWYRVRFTVPKALRSRELLLPLGRIDDADEAYLNGTRIGATGKFPPDGATAYTLRRVYRIPAGLLREENVLAVRVYDMMGPGGIVEGPVGLYTLTEYAADTAGSSGPSSSWRRLVTSNGSIAAVIDARRGMVEEIRPHIFQAYDSSRYVRPFLLRVTPALPGPPDEVRYLRNTHVIGTRYGDVSIDYYAPMTGTARVFHAAVSGPRSRVEGVSFSYVRGEGTFCVDSLLVPGEPDRATKYFLFGDSLGAEAGALQSAKSRLAGGGGASPEAEVAWMRGLLSGVNVPPGISVKERDVFEQSVTVLVMAQVGDGEVPAASRGQILASLPPGEWNIAWVRDGYYATLALNRLGLFARARKFLSFMLDAPSGQYVRYLHTDGKNYGVGVPYQISVTRYFGSGREESDYNIDGPNIELDGFGLFLSAFSDYVRRSGDSAFVRERGDEVARFVADPLVQCVDADGIVRIDSGPWERHLPGKRFAYTSIAAAAGLRAFGELCGRFGRAKDAARYLREALRVDAGIRSQFIVEGRVIRGDAGAAERTEVGFHDGGTIEAFTQGVIADPGLFATHMKEYEAALRIDGPRRGVGFSRMHGGDWYDTSEWIMLDLRAASAYHRFGRVQAARDLLGWVTDQASLNYNLIPELFDRKTGRYAGAVPMVGFGAGAYIVTLGDLSGPAGR